jgi:hypothetical protein
MTERTERRKLQKKAKRRRYKKCPVAGCGGRMYARVEYSWEGPDFRGGPQYVTYVGYHLSYRCYGGSGRHVVRKYRSGGGTADAYRRLCDSFPDVTNRQGLP